MKIYVYLSADGHCGGDVDVDDFVLFDSLEAAQAYGLRMHEEQEEQQAGEEKNIANKPSWYQDSKVHVTWHVADKDWFLDAGRGIVMIRVFEL